MFEQAFKNLDDELRKDSGCSTELDYIEQTSWVLFLKYLDDLETERESYAKLKDEKYNRILKKEFSWSVWAAPKTSGGKLDFNKVLDGEDLNDFANQKLIPYLKTFKSSSEFKPDTIEYKIGEIFSELKNKLQSGYTLRKIINIIDELLFKSNDEKDELSSLYEDKIKNMGNSGRNGGEYYTPRPLIKTIVKIINPKLGDKIYDPACGSAGFLCAAYEYLRQSKKELSAKELETLQRKTLYGKEKKSLAYIIGVMNMILHGIEAPNILHTNTLAENLMDVQEKDRVDVILANPPFGSSTEQAEVQQNFPIRSGETAYMFLQHFIKMLKIGGKCGVVIKNTFLSNTDNASVTLRKQLLEDCNLHTILDLPKGAFIGTGVQTVVLFFEKGKPTKDICYYQLNLDRNLGKTNSLNERDLEEFIKLSTTQAISKNSWCVNIKDINKLTWDLTVNNPNRKDITDKRMPEQILADIEKLDLETAKAIRIIKKELI
jgi:type I restriction enzyme M protein